MTDSRVVQADFDQIAQLSPSAFDHNAYYHDFLLKALQPHMNQALDVGCGTGRFTRLLAARADQVLALDSYLFNRRQKYFNKSQAASSS